MTVLDLFDGRESLRPLWEQVQGFREAVVPIMEKAPEGVHLICYSQGRRRTLTPKPGGSSTPAGVLSRVCFSELHSPGQRPSKRPPSVFS